MGNIDVTLKKEPDLWQVDDQHVLIVNTTSKVGDWIIWRNEALPRSLHSNIGKIAHALGIGIVRITE